MPSAGLFASMLRTAAEINELSDAEFAAGQPFDIEGTVIFVATTASPGKIPNINIYDKTGHTCILADENTAVPQTGDVIRVTGITSYDMFNQPVVNCTNIVHIGKTTIPQPEFVTLDALLRKNLNHRLLRTTGTVADAFKDEIDHRYNYMLLKHGASILPVAFPDPSLPESSLRNLVGAEISVVGVCCFLSGARDFLGPRLETTGMDNISILRPAPKDPFDVPPLKNIHRTSPAIVAGMGRHRITGRVLAVWNDNEIMLKAADGRFLKAALARNQPVPTYGQSVCVVGFPETDLFRINLNGAIWKESPISLPPEDPPKLCNVEAFLMDAKGHRQFRSHGFGQTLKIRGTVRDISTPGKLQSCILIDCGRAIIPVDAGASKDVFGNVSIGCVVEVSGICLMETENWRSDAPFPRVTGMKLILRTPADLNILSRPPWWTSKHLFMIIGALFLSLGAISIWNRVLNRLVEKRSRALLKEQTAHAGADLKVEERTRLAVELHDTLAQNLTGIALQIDAAQMAAEETPDDIMVYLESARLKMQNCRENLRDCLWDLRSRAFEEKELSEAISKTIAPHIGTVNVQTEMNIPCRKLSDNTIHAVLCIVRELVMNAIRHGKAKNITICSVLDDEGLSMTVTDDGIGFDSATRPGMSEGHFGLQGVSERAIRLGGSFEITSTIYGTVARLRKITPEA